MSGIYFQEEQGISSMRPVARRGGFSLVQFLIRKGIVSSEHAAKIVLVGVMLIAIGGAIGIQFFFTEKPQVVDHQELLKGQQVLKSMTQKPPGPPVRKSH